MEPDESSEQARRRKRTNAYLSMWAIPVDVSALPVPSTTTNALVTTEAAIGRAKAYCLTSLKGNGLSQLEVFAFADAYAVWDHLDLEEHDYVLEPEDADGPNERDRNFVWRSERLWAVEWALGLVRHLAFPDRSADPGEAVRMCMQELCVPEVPTAVLRPTKDVFDAADVAACLDAVAAASAASHEPAPSGMHAGVVFERNQALNWLVSGSGMT